MTKTLDPGWHSEDPAPREYAPDVRLVERSRFELDLNASVSEAEVEDWLLNEASKAPSALLLVQEFANRLAQSGLDVHRMALIVGTIHPQLRGYTWNWSSQDNICDETQIGRNATESDAYKKNPIYRVVEYGDVFRAKLPADSSIESSKLLDELAEDGFTEYVAFPLSSRGIAYNAVTLCSRRKGGFDSEQWQTLERLLNIFALHVERLIVQRIAQNISQTYLGKNAGERVVSGTIQRGSGLPIRAIVWSSDMRDFSTLSENVESEQVVSVLNHYFSVLADAVLQNGGDVLKFVGDGMLAVFPLAEFASPELAARAAASAALASVRNLEQLNQEMTKTEGWRPLKTGIGLHLGDVFFGNIGSSRRLDFTVIGEAVNIASRIEGLCKPLQREVLMSEQVASLVGSNTEAVGSHALKGMQKPENLFSLAA